MKFNKIAAALAAAALISVMAVSANAPYNDINGIKDKMAIDYLYDCRCLNFVKSDSFLPDQVMTRGEVAQLLYDGMANYQQNTTWIKDVKSPADQDAVSALVKRGIMKVYPDGTFRSSEPVTREAFAGMIYNYLKYHQLADADGDVKAYTDAGEINPQLLPQIQVLKSKNIMVPADNNFRPKQGVSRAEAVSTLYHLLKSDKNYISHVAVETAALKCISAQYGSPQAYFSIGTLYWQGDTLVLGMKSGGDKMLQKRLKDEVHPTSAVVIKKAKYSRVDYDLLINRAVRTVVRAEGVRNYIGAMPDYANEKLTIMVRRPVSAAVVDKINKDIGQGVVQFEAVSELGKSAKSSGQ